MYFSLHSYKLNDGTCIGDNALMSFADHESMIYQCILMGIFDSNQHLFYSY